MEEIYKLVRQRKNPEKILKLLNIKKSDVYKYTFESCSFVIAFNDKKTLMEVCHTPEMQDKWEEKENILFR